jgi:hypothetical protein
MSTNTPTISTSGTATAAPSASQITKAPTPPATNLAARVAAAAPSAPTAARPASLGKPSSTTGLLDRAFFRTVLYGETSARKTSTAAQFAGPEFTRIILTRPEDQLLPLEGQGYQYIYCPDAAALSYAIKNVDLIWPDWAAMPDPDKKRTVMVDDITKGVTFMVAANTARDNRMAYRDAQGDLDAAIQALGKKPYNQILISLAKTKDNNVTNVDNVGPELPPSILSYVLAEYTSVLYVKIPSNPLQPWKMLTDRDTVVYTDIVDGKEKTFTKVLFAKTKSSLLNVGKGPNPNAIQREEPLDLQKFWEKCRRAGGSK